MSYILWLLALVVFGVIIYKLIEWQDNHPDGE